MVLAGVMVQQHHHRRVPTQGCFHVSPLHSLPHTDSTSSGLDTLYSTVVRLPQASKTSKRGLYSVLSTHPFSVQAGHSAEMVRCWLTQSGAQVAKPARCLSQRLYLTWHSLCVT